MSSNYTLQNYNHQTAWQIQTVLNDPAFTFTDADNKTILTISCDGEVTWHNPEKADDAADLLVQHVNMSLEKKAGILYRRDQWENNIKAELMRIGQTREITPEVINEVFSKHKMVTVLQGKYHVNTNEKST